MNLLSNDKTTGFWCDPTDLLTPMRFDILFKYIYANCWSKGIEDKWVDDIYSHHLQVWNGLKELNPPKLGTAEYKESFNGVLRSIRDKGFNREITHIPVDHTTGSPLNGSHRIAASIVFNKDVYCQYDDYNTGQLCDYYYLANRTEHVQSGLLQAYADLAALQYVKLKPNTYIVTLFPSAVGYDDQVKQLVRQHAKLVYDKPIYLQNYGPFNFTRLLYDEDASRGNPWLGDWNNLFSGAQSKMSRCFTTEQPVRILLIEAKSFDTVTFLKENIRNFYGLGKHSAHINDTRSETLNIAGYVFNDNSIHFLNNCKPKQMSTFERCFKILSESINSSDFDKEDFCVGDSGPLAAYGLRDCRDLDFLYQGEDINTGSQEVSCHNKEMKYYQHDKNAIIFNPKNHFYYKGIKVASLNVIRSMKENRNEEKDVVDNVLINEIL